MIKTIQTVFEKFPDILLVTVFGSAVTGNLTKDSDIDIAVAAESRLNFEKKAEIYLALAGAFNREIDLIDLNEVVERIESKVPETCAALKADLDLQDIISLNLQRAVKICVDIAAHINAGLDTRPPSSMTESFDNLDKAGILSDSICTRMKKCAGYRNIAVHEYSTINWDVVFCVATKNINDFREFAKCIFTWLKKQS